MAALKTFPPIRNYIYICDTVFCVYVCLSVVWNCLIVKLTLFYSVAICFFLCSLIGFFPVNYNVKYHRRWLQIIFSPKFLFIYLFFIAFIYWLIREIWKNNNKIKKRLAFPLDVFLLLLKAQKWQKNIMIKIS